MKILFIEPYPTEGPSSRYRVEQYVPYFKRQGIRCAVRPFISSTFYKILYRKGFYLQKILYFLQSCIRRFLDLFIAAKSDIIFIHLESFPFGPPFCEYFFSRILKKKIMYDLDDAIYMGITSPVNRFVRCLRCPSKVNKIIKLSNYVITCNEYLADYARRYNKNVTAIHSSVDTSKFVPLIKSNSDIVSIGWIGSHSTAVYLDLLKEVFRKLAAKYRFKLIVVGAGDYTLDIPNINILNLEWRLDDEIGQFQSLDIGVYPLPDTEWVQGKTGFKTIQYMSVGVPCVVSNCGANRYIVEDGINGYLASSEAEWIEKLSKLIEDGELRRKMGIAGRKTVEKYYSTKVNVPKYLEIVNKVATGNLAQSIWQ